jgi:hypothetical protein
MKDNLTEEPLIAARLLAAQSTPMLSGLESSRYVLSHDCDIRQHTGPERRKCHSVGASQLRPDSWHGLRRQLCCHALGKLDAHIAALPSEADSPAQRMPPPPWARQSKRAAPLGMILISSILWSRCPSGSARTLSSIGKHDMTRPYAAALLDQHEMITARQIIEARIGKPWPPTHELAPDQRTALQRLGYQLRVAQNEKGFQAMITRIRPLHRSSRKTGRRRRWRR